MKIRAILSQAGVAGGKLSARFCKGIAEAFSLKRKQQVFLAMNYTGSVKISLINEFTEVEIRVLSNSQEIHQALREGYGLVN